MFLKIQTKLNGWHYITELQDITTWNYRAGGIERDKQLPMSDESFNYIEDNSPSGKIGLHAIRKNGKSISIIINTTTYMCNDEGKTIERLN